MTGWLDLRALPDERWRAMTLPGSRPEADVARLHVDESTGASVSLVRFPAGWERAEVGCYPVGEELVVLDGWLELSGVQFAAGDHGWVPPRVARTGTRSPDGALVLAMFTGPPQWLVGEGERRPGDVVRTQLHLGPLRQAVDDDAAGGWSVVVDEVTPTVDADRDVLDVGRAAWTFVPAGDPAPTDSAGGTDPEAGGTDSPTDSTEGTRPEADGTDRLLMVRTWP